MKTSHSVFVYGMLLIWTAAGGLCPSPAWGAEGAPLLLTPGEQRVLRFPGLSRYSLSGEGVRVLPLRADLVASPEEARESLLLKALTPSTGDLWVWKADGSTEHRPIQVARARGEGSRVSGLDVALSHLDEVEVYRAGDQVILRGVIHSETECSKLRAVEQAFPNAVRNEARLNESLAQVGTDRLKSWLASSAWRSQLRLEEGTGGPRLVGAIPETSHQVEARKQALQAFACTRVEISALPDESPTIYFRVFLLELKRDRLRSFGVGWPPSQLDAFRVTTHGLSDALQLDLAIQALEQEGSARVLSNPELAVRAPGEAELFAGGEIPVRATSMYSSDVRWKSYGLTLKLKVTHWAGESVRVEITTEVSHLDEKISDQELPSLQSNRMRTQVDAKFGKPLLLSGLLQQRVRERSRGLPWLRQIPVLGSLFGSEDFQQEKSELVAVLLPLREPPGPASLEMSREPRAIHLGPAEPEGTLEKSTGIESKTSVAGAHLTESAKAITQSRMAANARAALRAGRKGGAR